MLTHLTDIVETSEHVELIAACLRARETFRASRQLDVLDKLCAGQRGRDVVTA
ncbi:MAG: hypothetical protein M3Z25_06795 [Actinomycetota bacterium]|nr:hypothetical protein [Actinomycetota bacterium]